MQLKLKLVAEKSATTFGDLPDWLQSGHDSHGQSDTEIDKVKKELPRRDDFVMQI